ncbi:MAG: hypothetical protein NC082_02665 [Clostridiales bacterium]|nr:hypothetical protein [Clostridiales bacterium]
MKLPQTLDRPGHPDGMTVPDGFFDSFAEKLTSGLPANDLEQQPVRELIKPTTWQRVRPFVYMAAMFAGIWCMMKMFSMMHDNQSEMRLDASPVLSAAIDNDDFFGDYLLENYSEDQILEDLYASGIEVNDISL